MTMRSRRLRVERLEQATARLAAPGPTLRDVLPLEDPECVEDVLALVQPGNASESRRSDAAAHIHVAMSGPDGANWLRYADRAGLPVPGYVRRAVDGTDWDRRPCT